jgi:hypothetical protein
VEARLVISSFKKSSKRTKSDIDSEGICINLVFFLVVVRFVVGLVVGFLVVVFVVGFLVVVFVVGFLVVVFVVGFLVVVFVVGFLVVVFVVGFLVVVFVVGFLVVVFVVGFLVVVLVVVFVVGFFVVVVLVVVGFLVVVVVVVVVVIVVGCGISGRVTVGTSVTGDCKTNRATSLFCVRLHELRLYKEINCDITNVIYTYHGNWVEIFMNYKIRYSYVDDSFVSIRCERV